MVVVMAEVRLEVRVKFPCQAVIYLTVASVHPHSTCKCPLPYSKAVELAPALKRSLRFDTACGGVTGTEA